MLDQTAAAEPRRFTRSTPIVSGQVVTAADIQRGMKVVYRGEPRIVTYSAEYGSTWQLDFEGGWRAFVDPSMQVQVVGRSAVVPDRWPPASPWAVVRLVAAIAVYLIGCGLFMALALGMFA